MENNKQMQDRTVKELDEAGKIAKFYGFKPTLPPTVEKQDYDLVKGFDEESLPAEKAALLRMYFEEKLMAQPQPATLYCERPFHSGAKDHPAPRKKAHYLESSLITLGSYKCVCECLSVQAAISILHGLGHKNLEVEINTMGDKDSVTDFQRKMSAFVKKNYNAFPADLRQATKKDLCAILKDDRKELEGLRSEAPKSIDFLSEASRAHFKEFIEFLEMTGISYSINSCLTGDMEMGSEIIFTIKSEEGEELARGMRWNRLAKKIGYKKELPATVLNISAKLKKPLKKVKAKEVRPLFYLVQFGPEAKLKSFLILEELFKAGAPVIHAIAKDKLGSQMGVAETSEAPYIILIGQKEALENSVIIRDSQTRAQEIIPISELSAKAKELS